MAWLRIGILGCAATPSLADSPPAGEWTVITHGAVFDPSPIDGCMGNAWNFWMVDLANWIASLGTDSVIIHFMDRDTYQISTPDLMGDASKHHILLFDWPETSIILEEPESDDIVVTPDGYAYAAGDALYAFLRNYGIHDKVSYFIGHSRGAVVVSETTRRLLLDGISPQQVIYLDGEGGWFDLPPLPPFGYLDERFDAWLALPSQNIRYDAIYSTVWEQDADPLFPDYGACYFLPDWVPIDNCVGFCTFGLDFGGVPAAASRLWTYNLGENYRHGCCGGYTDTATAPPPVWEYLACGPPPWRQACPGGGDGLTFEEGLYQYLDTGNPAVETPPTVGPLAPDNWDGHQWDEKLFNGDFEWNSRAGWNHNGAAHCEDGGCGHVDLAGESSYHLELDQSDGYIEHSWSWVRAEHATLRMRYKVTNADGPFGGCDDSFKVTITQWTTDPQPLTVEWLATDRCSTDDNWQLFIATIPTDFRGSLCKLKLWKDPGANGAIDSEVRVDDVELVTLTEDNIHLVPQEFPTIQAAINAALEGDEVIVGDGTYTGTGNKNLDFGGCLITVRSASGDPTTCVIDCQNSGRGFDFHNGESALAIVDGFTITNGSSGSSPYPNNSGGGMIIVGSSPSVSNCIFQDNMVNLSSVEATGAGLAILINSNPQISDCWFIENTGRLAGGVGIRGNSNPTISNCAFVNNTAFDGGGLLVADSSSPVVSDCSLTGNSAAGGSSHSGGGMVIANNCNPTVIGCLFNQNTAAGPGGGISFGHTGPSVQIVNCTFTGNSGSDGGGAYVLSVAPTISSSSFCNNTPNDLGGAPFVDGGGNTFSPSCDGDVNADADVGILDFLALLEGWGPNPGHPADFDCDGTVGIVDFLALLGNWGPCQ